MSTVESLRSHSPAMIGIPSCATFGHNLVELPGGLVADTTFGSTRLQFLVQVGTPRRSGCNLVELPRVGCSPDHFWLQLG